MISPLHRFRPEQACTAPASLPMTLALGMACLLAPATSPAFPPAPHHTLYGLVRNQWGDPVALEASDVFLETPAGTQLRTSLVTGLEPGVNYRLDVPMDSGTAADL